MKKKYITRVVLDIDISNYKKSINEFKKILDYLEKEGLKIKKIDFE